MRRHHSAPIPDEPAPRPRGSGKPLPGSLRNRIEARHSGQFAGVRVYDDAHAHAETSRRGVAAFAYGDDLYFGQGAYRPGTVGGDLMIAHELAHSWQQQLGRAAGESALRMRRPVEQEADSLAVGALMGGMKRPARGDGLTVRGCIPESGPEQQLGPDYSDLSDWQTKSLEEIQQGDAPPTDNASGNRRITALYAQMYLRDPETYKWAGMAAYASSLVGRAMGQADRLREQAGTPGIGLGTILTNAPAGSTMERALTTGNQAVFFDIYWQHLAYESGGLEEIRAAHARGEMPDRVLEAWETIDAGRTALAEAKESGDSEALEAANDRIWSGNRQLLMFEQEETLQDGVYDHFPETFEWLSSDLNVMGLDSPIPTDDQQFGDVVEDGDIGTFDDRWKWIDERMLPQWRKLQEGDPERVRKDMLEFIEQGGLEP